MVKKNNLLKNLPHQKRNLGQKAADKVTKVVGSWRFIIIVVVYIIIWIGLNAFAIIRHWDPYPFIVLNLTLSCLAALQAPVILMSQNRSNEKDRRRMEYDYHIDRKTHKELQEIKQDVRHIKRIIRKKK